MEEEPVIEEERHHDPPLMDTVLRNLEPDVNLGPALPFQTGRILIRNSSEQNRKRYFSIVCLSSIQQNN